MVAAIASYSPETQKFLKKVLDIWENTQLLKAFPSGEITSATSSEVVSMPPSGVRGTTLAEVASGETSSGIKGKGSSLWHSDSDEDKDEDKVLGFIPVPQIPGSFWRHLQALDWVEEICDGMSLFYFCNHWDPSV